MVTIVHKIDDFLFNLFPSLKGTHDHTQLKQELESYYSYKSIKPNVTIVGDLITITIDTEAIAAQEKDYDKAIVLCEQGRFAQAKPLLKKLIYANPTNSNLHRILGQVYESEGRIDDAINTLIEALRWGPNNVEALVMMGNIFTRHQNDRQVAKAYFQKALEVQPDNHFTLTNLGSILMQEGKIEDAKALFLKVNSINPDYPNAILALAMLAERANDPDTTFSLATKALKRVATTDPVVPPATNLAINAAKASLERNYEDIINNYISEIRTISDKPVLLQQDSTIATPAKLELAEKYNRPHHIVKYRAKTPYTPHLIMHELVHLQFIEEARAAGVNELFISHEDSRQQFIKDFRKEAEKLRKQGISEENTHNFFNSLFSGINSQMFNTPIDLFIEQLLFDKYPQLRPVQFLSIQQLIEEGIKGCTSKQILELTPKLILTASRVLNLVNAIQFKSLFGFDVLDAFKAPKSELQQAQTLYDEWLTYKDDREPGEEYEIIRHWQQDLQLTKYAELIPEEKAIEKTDIDSLLDKIAADPYNQDREEDGPTFTTMQDPIGKIAIIQYMIGALQYFKDKPKEAIQKVAFEIAGLGALGINPSDKDARTSLASVPGKSFSNLQMLAWMYVSFQQINPDLDTGLDFKNEYNIALNSYS
ncbi:tetratricopeptide repeat protein [Chitinophagaceae bacterium LB-8]|uniref:Tetratricopeptide repeat protein n=1 Tax=Paraflavisolibacter caeni TaxID=2982496 RepID=A0A9X2XPA6_9BACT|nr:tetratricopeptide repeat protein [Paraflavisolibacter caeni]MCU7550394.1 tetratricopeptide repeat protein [Paraflavisolibacter caeni]